ncbi:hypothetical protein JXJ21_16655 [candidate division KSB1 bacterium]|nr:hypothetical protein [candidate division KSB1 bacterium]
MKRRTVLKLASLTGSTLVLPAPVLMALNQRNSIMNRSELQNAIDKLKGEPAAIAEVKIERGGPRLFLNGEEIYPLLALSAGMLTTTIGFRQAGINLLAPIIGLNDCWKAPGVYDFSRIELFFAQLLIMNPAARFLPRLHLNAPRWWKDAHPEELVKYGLPIDEKNYGLPERIGESGLNWNSGSDFYDVSYASDAWRRDTGELLRRFLRHIEESPLRSRMLGYQVTSGMTGEWHYIGSRHLPDYSPSMQKAIGPLPTPASRSNTAFGLLRDPAKERAVIEFYHRFHNLCADTILFFVRIVKQETQRRLLCGTFYAYLLENVMIQEAGHLAPQKILKSLDIDFIVSPYAYQHTNLPHKERWESDMVDDAGNWLGRARGVGGDGGYRVPLESVKRHGKLFIVEMDPATYVEPKRTGEGGSGHETVEGTRRILQRDLGRMFAAGIGGWLYDFGPLVPPFKAGKGWYDDPPIIEEIRRFLTIGENRLLLNIESEARIAAVYDAESFFVTQHWKSEEPWTGYGISLCDYFNHWFLNSQARTFHRIGAPMDFLYRFDLGAHDAEKYRLIFMVNTFYMQQHEVRELRGILKDSGTTVVWFYAPGFIAPEKLDLQQMEALTGFKFKPIDQPGPMMIETAIKGDEALNMKFGVEKHYFPRFSVIDDAAEPLGNWTDGNGIAFARKAVDGWQSVYAGAAPLPVEILRWLAREAGVALWSTKPDIISATRDAVTIVATESGERILNLPKPMTSVNDKAFRMQHTLNMEFGDVRLFISNDNTKKGSQMDRLRTPIKTNRLVVAPSYKQGEFDSHAVDCPFLFSHAGKYYMTFVGWDSIGYRTGLAVSDDLIHWEKLGMIIDRGPKGSVTEFNIAMTNILRKNDLYSSGELKRINGKFVGSFHAYPRPGYESGPAVIGLCFSDDLRHWEIGDPILTPNPACAWEAGGLYKSWLMQHDGTYYLFYNAKTAGRPWIEQTGVALSTDLVHWNRYPENPVLKIGAKGAFDDIFASDPAVLRCGDQWVMFYFGNCTDGHARDSVAFSEDLLRWTKSNEVLIDVGAPGSIDSRYAHKAGMIAREGRLYHFYCAVSPSEGRKLGEVENREIRGISVAHN